MHRTHFVLFGILVLSLLGVLHAQNDSHDKYHAIRVVDAESGRGVPMVQLKTTANVAYYTDSNGYVAFYEPGIMDTSVYFFISSDGYEYEADDVGFRGKAINVTLGGFTQLSIKRTKNIAQRLYRTTGLGVYRDSVLLGVPVPIDQPLIDAQVVGLDSTMNVIYQSKLYWFWGDTNKPSYPLGNFFVTGATTALPNATSLIDIDAGKVNYKYITDGKGFVKPMAPVAPFNQPTWLGDTCTIFDPAIGREIMVASFMKPQTATDPPMHGLLQWNDATQSFDVRKIFDPTKEYTWPVEVGHATTIEEKGVEYLYFMQPYAMVRVPKSVDAFFDAAAYEAFTPLVEGTTYEPEDIKTMKLDKNADGSLRFAWKRNTAYVTMSDMMKLALQGGIATDDIYFFQLRDLYNPTKTVFAQGGHITWNEYRKRYVMTAVQGFGDNSFLGEVWYSEADNIMGPWLYAVKIVTHDAYSFYNPKQHPYFSRDNGRVIYFEGTYSATMSRDERFATPLYDYNNQMYKLELDDVRLAIPVAIYRNALRANRALSDRRKVEMFGHKGNAVFDDAEVAFYAFDRDIKQFDQFRVVPVFQNIITGQLRKKSPAAHEKRSWVLAFYALDLKDAVSVGRSDIVQLAMHSACSGKQQPSCRYSYRLASETPSSEWARLSIGVLSRSSSHS